MLMNISEVLWPSNTRGKFHKTCSRNLSLVWLWKVHLHRPGTNKLIDPHHVSPGIFRTNYVSRTVADTLASALVRSSVATILSLWNDNALVFLEWGWTPSFTTCKCKCRGIVWNANDTYDVSSKSSAHAAKDLGGGKWYLTIIVKGLVTWETGKWPVNVHV